MSRWSAIWFAAGLAACSAPDLGVADDYGHDPGPRADDHGTFAVGGIVIDRITFDQGVSVDVYEDGEARAAEDYRTTLVSGRNTYVRAMWDVPEDWEPRAIEARIGIHHANGDVDYAVKTLDIDGPSNENWLEGAFAWYLPGEWLEEGIGIDVALYEVDPEAAPDLPPSATTRAPIAGILDVAVSQAPREMDVLIVPINHTYDGGKDCGGAPDITDMMQKDMKERLQAINPVERVNLSVRDEPLVFDQPANQFGIILDELSALREKDGAPPWLYYYGLIDLCDWGSDQGFSGQARVPDELTKDYSWKRVAVGTVRVSYGGILGTFVHELGHTQGRYHVPCDGEAAIEHDYPYRDAVIASVGFDTVKWTLHPATHKDYMSYCGPDWVGEYGWNKVVPVATTLTKWKLEGASWEPGPGSLVGSIYPDGTERWWVVRDRPPVPASAPHRLRFQADVGGVLEVPVRVKPHVLDDGVEVVAPLPLPLERVVGIERLGPWGGHAIDVEGLRRESAL